MVRVSLTRKMCVTSPLSGGYSETCSTPISFHLGPTKEPLIDFLLLKNRYRGPWQRREGLKCHATTKSWVCLEDHVFGVEQVQRSRNVSSRREWKGWTGGSSYNFSYLVAKSHEHGISWKKSTEGHARLHSLGSALRGQVAKRSRIYSEKNGRVLAESREGLKRLLRRNLANELFSHFIYGSYSRYRLKYRYWEVAPTNPVSAASRDDMPANLRKPKFSCNIVQLANLLNHVSAEKKMPQNSQQSTIDNCGFEE